MNGKFNKISSIKLIYFKKAEQRLNQSHEVKVTSVSDRKGQVNVNFINCGSRNSTKPLITQVNATSTMDRRKLENKEVKRNGCGWINFTSRKLIIFSSKINETYHQLSHREKAVETANVLVEKGHQKATYTNENSRSTGKSSNCTEHTIKGPTHNACSFQLKTELEANDFNNTLNIENKGRCTLHWTERPYKRPKRHQNSHKMPPKTLKTLQ